MTEYAPIYDEDEWPPDYEDEEDQECDSCDPWCPEWMGDGLCMVAIEEQPRQQEEYLKRHVRATTTIPGFTSFTKFTTTIDSE